MNISGSVNVCYGFLLKNGKNGKGKFNLMKICAQERLIRLKYEIVVYKQGRQKER